MSPKLRIAITGATGVMGSVLLFEYLRRYWDRLESIEIVLFGRAAHGRSFNSRIAAMLSDAGCDYVGARGTGREAFVARALGSIRFVDGFDLRRPDPCRWAAAVRPGVGPLDHFFHFAALTDFPVTAAQIADGRLINVGGTQAVLDLVASYLPVREFVHISTAYACGAMAGSVPPESLGLDRPFRNPYERSKAEAELLVRRFAGEHGLPFRIFRPSVVAGCLLSEPLGYIARFDVFYAWAAAFLRRKLALGRGRTPKGALLTRLAVRVHVNPASGANIVPVDFAARAIVETCERRAPGIAFHISNPQSTPFASLLGITLRAVGVDGVEFVDEQPADLNREERFYYGTVGRIFGPYLTAPPIEFERASMENALRGTNLTCPTLNEANLLRLMSYAKRRNFGLNRETTPTSVAHRTPLPATVSA